PAEESRSVPAEESRWYPGNCGDIAGLRRALDRSDSLKSRGAETRTQALSRGYGRRAEIRPPDMPGSLKLITPARRSFFGRLPESGRTPSCRGEGRALLQLPRKWPSGYTTMQSAIAPKPISVPIIAGLLRLIDLLVILCSGAAAYSVWLLDVPEV